MNKRLYFLLIIITILFMFNIGLAIENRFTDSVSSASCCGDCHEDFVSLVRDEHPIIPKNSTGFCLECHKTDSIGEAKPRPFSTLIHKTHTSPEADIDCCDCHDWVPDKRFSLPNQPLSFGSPDEKEIIRLKQVSHSWLTSDHLDNIHAKNMVACSSCHGPRLPNNAAIVPMARCLSCHYSYEKIAKETVSEEFPDINPHDSHNGEIECTSCHHLHQTSQLYCLECHDFDIKVP
ncbi:cytochrome c3 family protein [Thermodesulfobacteriota bacterium]